MAYRSYQPDRRARRRRWLLILLTLVGVIAIVVVLVTRQTEQRGTVEFLAAADEVSAIHGRASETFRQTLAQLGPELSRQEVKRRLADMTEAAAEASALLEVDVPPSLGAVYGNLTAATAAWEAGLVDFERVVLGVMDTEITSAAEVQMEGAFDLLRAGDVAYGRFLDDVPSIETDVGVPTFPVIRYIEPDPDNPTLYDAQNLVLRIQASYNLAPRHDVGVVGMTLPEAVGQRGGIPVVPFAESIDASAIVSNLGNEQEDRVVVEVTMLNVDSGDTITATSTVEGIAGGASTTVTFPDLAITPGGLYQMTLTATIPVDTNPENNMWSMTFIWNEAS